MIDAVFIAVGYLTMIGCIFALLRLNRWRRYLVTIQNDTFLTEVDVQIRQKKVEIRNLFERFYPDARSIDELSEIERASLQNDFEMKSLVRDMIKLLTRKAMQEMALWYTS